MNPRSLCGRPFPHFLVMGSSIAAAVWRVSLHLWLPENETLNNYPLPWPRRVIWNFLARAAARSRAHWSVSRDCLALYKVQRVLRDLSIAGSQFSSRSFRHTTIQELSIAPPVSPSYYAPGAALGLRTTLQLECAFKAALALYSRSRAHEDTCWGQHLGTTFI